MAATRLLSFTQIAQGKATRRAIAIQGGCEQVAFIERFGNGCRTGGKAIVWAGPGLAGISNYSHGASFIRLRRWSGCGSQAMTQELFGCT